MEMDEFKEELKKVMHKIANYVPWQEEEVNEDDFRILNQASGADLADISYRYRINISRFIKNSNKLIDDYNERVLLSRINDVATIKRSLQTTFAFKVDKPKQKKKTPIAIVAAAQSSGDLIDINEQMFQRGLITEAVYLQRKKSNNNNLAEKDQEVPVDKEPAVPSFVSKLLNSQSHTHAHTISHHRDALREPDSNRINGNITANEQIPVQYDQLNPFVDDFGELNNEDAARLGLFDGEQGERLYNTLKNRKTLGEVMPHPIEKSIELPPNNLEVPMQEVPRAGQISLNNPEILIEEQILLPNQEVPIEEQMLPAPELPFEEQHPAALELEQNLPEQQLIPTLPEAEAQVTPAEVTRESDLFTERYENFRISIEQAKNLMKEKPKRRQRRPLAKEMAIESEEDGNDNELILFKKRNMSKLKKMTKRSQPFRIETPKPIVAMNILSEIQAFNNDFVPFEELQVEEERSIRPEVRLSRPEDKSFRPEELPPRNTSTPMSQPQKRTNISPPLQPSSKRVRPTIHLDVPELPLELNVSPIVNSSIVPHADLPPPAPQLDATPIQVPIEENEGVATLLQEEFRDVPPAAAQTPIQQSLQIQTPIQRSLQLPPSKLASKVVPRDLHDTLETITLPSSKVIEQQARHQPTVIDSRRQLSTTDAILEGYAVTSAIEARKVSHLESNVSIIPAIIVPDQEIQPEIQPVELPIENLVEPVPIDPPQRPGRKTIRKTVAERVEHPTVTTDGEVFYEIAEEDATIVRESKYSFDIFVLYLQVRLLMKKYCGPNPWKMDVNKLIDDHKVQLGGKTDPARITVALWMLAHRGYFIPTFSDNGNELLSIEIPLNRRETGSSEKENNP